MQTLHAGFDVCVIFEAVGAGVSNRSQRSIDLGGEIFGRRPERGELGRHCTNVFGEVGDSRFRSRADSVAVTQAGRSSRARRDVDYRRSDQGRARTNLGVRISTHARQRVFQYLGRDDQSLGIVHRRRAEGDVFHEAFFLSRKPDVGTCQHTGGFVGHDVQGHFLAVKGAHPREH